MNRVDMPSLQFYLTLNFGVVVGGTIYHQWKNSITLFRLLLDNGLFKIF